mmetsp:Transcript_15586/g.27326  ORF Transcript_15586/g.27326 Transcript_15586/m.27326 type:complete len:317 (+) Transcript_15586:84-1034(+)
MGGMWAPSWKFMGNVMAALLTLSLADESSFDLQADECSESSDCALNALQARASKSQADDGMNDAWHHHHHHHHHHGENHGRLDTNSSTGNKGHCESPRTPQYTKCRGCPPMYKGKPCASSTRYNNKNLGACGCGNRYRADRERHIKGGLPKDYWTLTSWTAAMNCVNLDSDGDGSLAWCPSKCGSCYKLCATGGLVQSGHDKSDNGGCGEEGCPGAGVCKTFKVVDRCGDGFDQGGKPNWCSQKISEQQCQDNPGKCKKSGNTNWYGYPAHFDLQDLHGQVLHGLGWDNAEITYEKVSCDSWHAPKNAEECRGCSD